MTQTIERVAQFTDLNTQDIDKAMYNSGYDFEVAMKPLYLQDGTKVWDKQAVVRTDTNKYLGAVGMQTRHVQPKDFYAMAAELINSTGGRINQGITMSNGAVIGVSFTLDSVEYVTGDVIDLNFLMLTSYNSAYAILGRALSHRFFCLNQLPSSQKLFNIKNTTGNLQRLQTATKMLGYYGKEMQDFNTKMKLLSGFRMSDSMALEWFSNLLPQPKKDSKRSNSIYTNTIETFTECLVNGMGVDHPGVRQTGYGALNALTEFCNHYRSTRVADGKSKAQVKFESLVLGGSNDKLMAKGFESLVKIAQTTPSGSIV